MGMEHRFMYDSGESSNSVVYYVREISPSDFRVIFRRHSTVGGFKDASETIVKSGITTMEEAETYAKERYKDELIKAVWEFARSKHPDFSTIETEFESNQVYVIVETGKVEYTYHAVDLEEPRISLTLVREMEIVS